MLESNPLGLESGPLAFPEETDAVLTLSLADGNTMEWLIVLDNVERFFPLRYGLPAAAKGAWESTNTFAIDVDEIGNRNRQRIRVTFEGDQVTIEAQTGADRETIVGRLEK